MLYSKLRTQNSELFYEFADSGMVFFQFPDLPVIMMQPGHSAKDKVGPDHNEAGADHQQGDDHGKHAVKVVMLGCGYEHSKY
jgi:hypothetical protein